MTRLGIWIAANNSFSSYFKDPLNFIDIVSSLPFFLEFITGLRGFQVIRLLRSMKLWRVARRTRRFRVVIESLQRSMGGMVLFLGVFFIIMFVYSTVLYFIESASCSLNANQSVSSCSKNLEVLWWISKIFDSFIIYFYRMLYICSKEYYYFNGPDKGSLCQFQSILDALWLAAATMSAVGYGDMVPSTPGAKVLTTGLFFVRFGLPMLPSLRVCILEFSSREPLFLSYQYIFLLFACLPYSRSLLFYWHFLWPLSLQPWQK